MSRETSSRGCSDSSPCLWTLRPGARFLRISGAPSATAACVGGLRFMWTATELCVRLFDRATLPARRHGSDLVGLPGLLWGRAGSPKGPSEPGVVRGEGSGPRSTDSRELRKLSLGGVNKEDTERAAGSPALFPQRCCPSSWQVAGRGLCTFSPFSWYLFLPVRP